MRAAQVFPATAAEALRGAAHWDWIVTSHREMDEERAGWCRNNLGDIPRLTLCREAREKPYCFAVVGNDRRMVADWSGLGEALGHFIKAGERVLVDITMLGFEAMLYVLPTLARRGLSRLSCLYASPSSYPFVLNENAYLDMRPIEQPRGHVALSADTDRQDTLHVMLLGFDRGRPWKFIEKYDWDFKHLHLVVGDPPFVAEGEALALQSCEPWLKNFLTECPGQLHRIPAHSADGVAALLARIAGECHWLDIVPLGPKPMLLGVLAFYFGLDDKGKSRVRLLYDFPEPRESRSRDVSKIYLYDYVIWSA